MTGTVLGTGCAQRHHRRVLHKAVSEVEPSRCQADSHSGVGAGPGTFLNFTVYMPCQIKLGGRPDFLRASC